MASYVIGLHQILQRYWSLQRGLLGEQQFRVARIRAADTGQKRKEILSEDYRAQSIENHELLELSSGLSTLRAPAAFSAFHHRLRHAVDEMVAANHDTATARNSKDKLALSRAHQRELDAVELWRAATNELKTLRARG